MSRAAHIHSLSRLLLRVGAYLRKHLSEHRLLLLTAIIVGVAAGLGAALLKILIKALSAFVTATGQIGSHPVWWVVILPVVGFGLSALYCRYVARADLEHGTEKILTSLADRHYRLKPTIAFSPIIACVFTISFGGSAGSEGPIAYTGAGMGSNLGRLLGLPDRYVRLLLGIGGAAGIAGIFKAPLGGALFALEVLHMEISGFSVLALIASCLAASSIAYVVSGSTLDVAYTATEAYTPAMFLGIVVLGLFCGIYSIYYSWLMRRTEQMVTRIRSTVHRVIITGLLVGTLLLIFPPLYGEGYGFIDLVINGDNPGLLNHSLFTSFSGIGIILAFLGGIILVKSMATSATNSGGGVGGDFAPTLFAGCMAGLLFAMACNTLFGTHFDAADFAFFGMAAVMAGAIHAPLMAIFLTVEMAGDYAMLFPLAVAAVVSYFTVRVLHIRLHLAFRPTWLHRH